jgi:hypothetical protein
LTEEAALLAEFRRAGEEGAVQLRAEKAAREEEERRKEGERREQQRKEQEERRRQEEAKRAAERKQVRCRLPSSTNWICGHRGASEADKILVPPSAALTVWPMHASCGMGAW